MGTYLSTTYYFLCIDLAGICTYSNITNAIQNTLWPAPPSSNNLIEKNNDSLNRGEDERKNLGVALLCVFLWPYYWIWYNSLPWQPLTGNAFSYCFDGISHNMSLYHASSEMEACCILWRRCTVLQHYCIRSMWKWIQLLYSYCRKITILSSSTLQIIVIIVIIHYENEYNYIVPSFTMKMKTIAFCLDSLWKWIYFSKNIHLLY